MFGNSFSDDFTDDYDIDLTPLIDAVFMLIIFFVMTSGALKATMPLDLPSASTSEAVSTDKKFVSLAVDSDGRIFFREKQIEVKDIKDILEMNPGYGVNLQVDKKSPFEIFVKVTDELRGFGTTDVNVSTLSERKD